MNSFCTYFDSNYLARGLAMWDSLRRVSNGDPVKLYVLCLDVQSFRLLSEMRPVGLVPISLEELERKDAELVTAKGNRSRAEYYFTLTSSFSHYLLTTLGNVDVLTYLDADLFFFSPWQSLLEEMRKASVMIIPHRFSNRLRKHEVSGLFNVGWISFRNNEEGRACAQWWRMKCLEWCYDRYEDGKFADQKYLDEWPMRFPGVHICKNIGANVAPWNIDSYQVRCSKGTALVDNQPLVFYHFQGYRWINSRFLEPGLAVYGDIVNKGAVRCILLPYAQQVLNMTRHLVREYEGYKIGEGNTRWHDNTGIGIMYGIRLALEGRVMVRLVGRLVYLRSGIISRLLPLWDRLHRRAER